MLPPSSLKAEVHPVFHGTNVEHSFLEFRSEMQPVSPSPHAS